MMESVITRDGTSALLQAGGDIVVATVPEYRAQLRELVQAGVRDLVFDLGNTRMIDSCGIGLLMAVHNSLEKVEGKLRIIHASPEINVLFVTMRLNQHITIAED
jgi:anti-anti-sigma factor